MSCFAVGIMSGTSMDGIDACVVDIKDSAELGQAGNAPQLKLIGFITCPYTSALQADLVHLSSSGDVAQVSQYNVLLGRMFADAARKAVSECGLAMEQISVIGSHGQTIHHLPSPIHLHGYTISSTLQIGDPSVIANECGVTTVGDFRVADMAVGGQGAPLVPYLDEIILKRHFEETGRFGLLLNIGGISNISASIQCSGSGLCGSKFIGFDCGPGNVLIDMLVKKWYNQDCDYGGQRGLLGKVSQKLLDQLLEDDYIRKMPPKSTGREYYCEAYLEDCLSKMDKLCISREDCIATLADFTAKAVWRNYHLFIEPLVGKHSTGGIAGCDLFVSGGGAKNKAIMRGLEEAFRGFQVKTTDDIGIDPDAKEAICFALLGYQTWKGRPSNIPSVTGAREEVILGKICYVHKS